jgi:alpha-L-arabinofuranosidase
MESYAPLLVRVDPGGGEWPTNLIGFDGLHSFGSPAYYVQSIFAQNTGSQELPVKIQQPVTTHAAPPAPSGAIGLGTWNTQSQYRNITVTNNGQILYQSNFASTDSEWTFEQGKWNLTDGALTQTSNATSAMAYTGDPNWTDYTLKLQARKLSGAEGFLIVVHRKNSRDFVQYNFGGWGNTRTTIQRFYQDGDSQEIAPSLSQTVNPNQWYNIEIDVKGSHIACFIDGQPSTNVDDKPLDQKDTIFSSASRSKDGKNVYLKVVNVGDNPVSCDLEFPGSHSFGDGGEITEISGDPSDQNSIAEPEKVHPVKSKLNLTGSHGITHTFAAHTVTVLTLNQHT